ncbi:MAG: prepilin-type N-terminal cleavage/methylation domain-containing protein [Chthonomonas sp.]|nr:prepilin-type N-terminal cleavage/methylation domain-containing protein [Chthonomonas sp.]
MNEQATRRTVSKAFTLVELLVVIGIIAILASILYPVFARAQSAAVTTACASNLKQLGLGAHLYVGDNDDRAFPSYYYSEDFSTEYAWDFQTTWGSSLTTRLGLLGSYLREGRINACPHFHGETWGRPYSGYAYNTTFLGGDVYRGTTPAVITQVADPSDTVLFADAAFGETAQGCNYLRAPSDPLFSAGTVHFRHAETANWIRVDGSIRKAKMKFHRLGETGGLSQGDEVYDLE